MTKTDLLKRLAPLPDDAVVILKGDDGGWCNLSGKVEMDGCCIVIREDHSRPFSSDN